MRYDAFISYRHSELDMDMAKRIHSGLEGFRVPRSIQKKYGKKNIKRVFRDQEELPIGSDLDDNISKALSESEYLIVICSPRTRESYWVLKEIGTFIQMHDRQHVLAVLVEGEPDESFPPLLLTDDNGEAVEPLAADVRGATNSEIKKKLKTELLRLAAPLLGCTYDDLKQRHRERKIKRICTAVCALFSAVAVLGVGFAIYNAHMAAQIDKNYKKAMENQYKYMADNALSLFENGYRKDAVLVALEALNDKNDDMPYVPQAEYALSEALYTYDSGNSLGRDGMLEHETPVDGMQYDMEGCHLISNDRNRLLYIWNVDEGNKLETIIKPTDESADGIEEILDYNHVGNEIIVCTDKAVRSYSIDGDELWNIPTDEGIGAIINGKDNVVISVATKKISVFDIATHKLKISFTPTATNNNYVAKYKYDDALGMFYVGCGESGKNAAVEAINITNNTAVRVDLYENYLAGIACSADGFFYTISYDIDAIIENPMLPYDAYIQKFDLNSGSEEWKCTTECVEGSIKSSSNSIIKYRDYTDDNGEEHKEVVVVSYNRIVCLDAVSGELISEFNMSGSVRSVLLSTTVSLGYAAMSNGRIEVLDFTSGNVMSDYTIDTGLNIVDLKVYNSTFAVLSYSSPDVMIFKYHTGRNINQILSTDDSINEVCTSADGTIIAASSGSLEASKINIIVSEGDEYNTECIDWSKEGFSGKKYINFTEDNKLFICDGIGKTALYNLNNLNKKTLSINYKAGYVHDDVRFNPTGPFALARSKGELVVLNLSDGEVTGQWTVCELGKSQDYILDALVTSDGSKVYYVTNEKGLNSIDVKSGVSELVTDEISNPCSSSQMKQVIAVSGSGSYLAIACKDGKLKIYDTVNRNICGEIDYTGYSNSFIRFSEDESKLTLQGDNYYIYIYDVSTCDKLYTSEYQYDTINDVVELNDNNNLALCTVNGILVLETDSYVPVAEISEGRMITKDGRVLTSHINSIYEFPFQSVDSLKEDADEQFNGETLTEAKRIKYHMSFTE